MIPSSFSHSFTYKIQNPDINYLSIPYYFIPYIQSHEAHTQQIFVMNPNLLTPPFFNENRSIINKPNEEIKEHKFEFYRSESLSIQERQKINLVDSPQINANEPPNTVPILQKSRNEPSTVKSAIITLLQYKKESSQLKSKGIRQFSKMACQNLKLSKKTIDDYLMYVRKGIILELINEEVMNYSFGKFRKIVKGKSKEKKMKKWDKRLHKDVDEIYSSLIL